MALMVSYYLGVHTGIALTLESSPVSAIWPPNAILLAVLLLRPQREWWVLVAAVLPAHLLAQLPLGVPLMMALCWFVSNVAEAVVGAAIILRVLGGIPRLERILDLSVFLIAGVLVAPLLTSFLDAAFIALVGWRYDGNYWEIWYIRLLSNALAALTLVPLIVIGCQRGLRPLRDATVRERAEIGVVLTGICTTSAIAFLSPADTRGLDVLVHAPLPFLMWAAVRQGVGSVSLGASLMALFAIVGVVQGRGPFATAAPEQSAMAVQAFLIIVVASLMLLAASLTELRLARRAALRQEESLNLALRAARMKAWDWDLRSDRMTWRPTSKRGVEIGPASSKSISALFERIHPDDRAMVRRAIEAALETGADGEVEVEYRIFDADRNVRWVTSKGKVTVDSRGRPKRMIGVHMDTTERKRHETEVRRHREQLTHLSRVSTLGELSGAIAHELNQPLTAILNNAQAAQWLLADPAPDLGDVAEILQEIISEDRRAGEMIRTLRALFVRGAVQRDQVDVNECIREALMIQHSDLVVRNVFVDTELAPDIPLVNGDRVELQQVLMNLIVNACDAMADNEQGDRRLRIVSAANVSGGIDVDVSDNGHGVRDVAAIFEPFHTSKDNGIGLGLSICRTIITAHHGRIWATNNASRGATFHIKIPARPAESVRFSSGRSSNGDSRGASRGRTAGDHR